MPPAIRLILALVVLAPSFSPAQAAAREINPTAVLDPQPARTAPPGSGFLSFLTQDAVGEIWALETLTEGPNVRRVSHWTGSRWEETPVVVPRHPGWSARPAPPWSERTPLLIPGNDGSLLVVTTRDVYQDVAAQMPAERLDWRDVSLRGDALARERGSHWWLEAYLHRNGQWTGPQPIDPFLREHFPVLVKAFNRRVHLQAVFDLHGDGARLWAAWGGSVSVYERDGVPQTAAIHDPRAVPARRESYGPPLVSLLPRPDGVVWAVAPDAQTMTELRWTDGRLDARELSGANVPLPYPDTDARSLRFYADPAGELWASARTDNWTYGGTAFSWDGAAWSRSKTAGLFALEGRDGAAWFHREFGTAGIPAPGYRRLVQGSPQPVPLFDRLDEGHLTRAPQALARAAGEDEILIASCYVRDRKGPDEKPLSVVIFFAPPKPGERDARVLRTYAFAKWQGQVPLFLDTHGNLVAHRAFVKLPEPLR